MAIFGTLTTFAWAIERPTEFSNRDSVVNTRHDLTQNAIMIKYNAPSNSLPYNPMAAVRNQYNLESCVYCHTPHGANSAVAAPLWNRTIKATTYTTYNTPSLTQPVSQPGINSLTCLSCHDGQTAIDSIINMPIPGYYLASQATTQNTAFLDSWRGLGYGTGTLNHMGLNSNNNIQGGTFPDAGCFSCHSDPALADDGNGYVDANGDWIGGYSNFSVALIGTDLTNDHPVGVTFPAVNGPGTDWNTPGGVKGSSLYFDMNGNGKMDKAEVRTYDGRVECASCHDPHGVPSAGPGSMFKPTFLRVDNAGSALCLTCHAK